MPKLHLYSSKHFTNINPQNMKTALFLLELRKFVAQTWRHLFVAFVLQVFISVFATFLRDQLELFGQCLIAMVTWFIFNYGFEIYQKGRGGSNTKSQMFQDCIAAAIGGVLGVLAAQVFI